MKLPELKELAKQMGLRGTSTMRKPELLATLQAARNGGEPPAGVTVRAPKAAKTAKVVKAPQSDAAEANTTDNADVATQSPAPAPAATEPQLDLPLPVADDAKKDETEPRRTRRKAADDAASEPRAARRRRDDDQPDFARRKPRKKADEAGDLLATLDLGDAAPTERRRERHEDVEVPLIRESVMMRTSSLAAVVALRKTAKKPCVTSTISWPRAHAEARGNVRRRRAERRSRVRAS